MSNTPKQNPVISLESLAEALTYEYEQTEFTAPRPLILQRVNPAYAEQQVYSAVLLTTKPTYFMLYQYAPEVFLAICPINPMDHYLVSFPAHLQQYKITTNKNQNEEVA